MKNEVLPRTEEALEALEEAICQCHGDLNTACRQIGVPARHVHMWALADPEVQTRIRQAQMIGWAGLESAAYQRAVLGVEKPVFYKGEEVGTITEYSDTLLSKMLQARVPGYGENTTHQHMHMVNVQVMPRAASYEDWVKQREHELAAATNENEDDNTRTIEGTARLLPSPATAPSPAQNTERASMAVIQGRIRELNATGDFGKLRDVL